MPNPPANHFLALSQKLYRRLLAAYPRRHREEYGGAMMQLFRDQCRDAWEDRQTWGLAALWLRTLPDLVKTSFLERWSNFNPGKYISNKMNAFFKLHNSPSSAYWMVFIIVFLLVFSTAVTITFILPESYASTARIKVEGDTHNLQYAQIDPAGENTQTPYDPFFLQTTFEIIQSPMVLSNVVATVSLNKSWGKKYYGGEDLTTSESMDLLKRRMDLAVVRNTKLIAITVYSDDKHETAQLANAIAQAYADYRANSARQQLAHGLRGMEENSRANSDKIEQLQADRDALAQKFGIVENSEDTEKNYRSQMIDGNRTLEALNTQLSRLQALDKNKLRDVLPTITGDTMLSDLAGKLHVCEQQLATLANDYAPADMHIVHVNSTITELNREIDARVAGIMAALESEVASKQAALVSLRTAIDRQRQDAKPTPENQPYWDKKHALADLLNFQKALEATITEQKLEQLNPPMLVEITDAAVPGNTPVKPNKPLNILAGAIGGVLAGSVAGSFAMFIAGRRVKRKPALGAV